MARFFTGLEGKVTAVSTDLNVTGWTATETAERIDVTHTGSSGNRVYIAGPTMVSGSVTANWDAEANWTDSPGITAGVTVALTLYLEDASGAFWSIPTAFIEEITNESSVNGVVSMSFRYSSTGTYTHPSGTF